MYIKQVTIKNYRNFGYPAFTIELKPFTLILGENNIGKTNLLNALGLIFSQEITIFRKRLLEIDDINYEAVENFKRRVSDLTIKPSEVKYPKIIIEVILTDMNDDQEAVVGDWFINKELTEVKITYVFEPRASFDKTDWVKKQREMLKGQSLSNKGSLKLIDFPIGEYRYSIFGGDNPSNECNPYYLKMLRMEFLDALRNAQRELIASGDYRLLYRILSHRDESKYENIKRKLNELESEISTNPNLKSIKDEVKTLLDRVSLQTTTADNSVDFSFSAPETTEMLKKISLIYGTNPINVARNGLGRNNLLYISLILSHLSAKDTRGSPTYFRLITIEEPEAHLHPHLQDHLAENIEGVRDDVENKQLMQLLLTSHSTHIAAKLNLGNTVIIFNDAERSCLSSHYILSGLDTKKDKQTIHYLSKYLDATKSRMFFARKIILIEGIAEQLLIPKFFELHFGSSVERQSCNVINVGGVAFRHFLKVIISGFFIKCVVFTDRDTDKRSEDRAENLKRDFDHTDLVAIEISEESTFEKDLIAANRIGKGKEIILDALRETRPINGKKLADTLGNRDIDVQLFFDEIENYKSEFAFNLLKQLNKPEIQLGFTIPNYIKRGFKFMG